MSKISRSPYVASPLLAAPPDLGLPDPVPGGSGPGARGGLVPEGPALEPGFDDVPRRRLVPPVAYDADGYPCGDGEPMAENEAQWNQMVYAGAALKAHYRDRPEVLVLGNVFINYREGDRTTAVAPDLCVAFGARVRKHDRSSYKVWEEPVPSFVMEMLSPSTQGRDLRVKWNIYRWMGVGEYWLYDPHGDWLEGRLAGHRRTSEGVFESIVETAPGSGEYWSEVLGLRLRDEDGDLRFHDPHTGQDLPTPVEAAIAREAEAAAREAAEARAAREAVAREAEAARADREAAAREAAEARAARETAAREAEAARADREAAAREAAEARIAELEVRLRGQSSPG